MMRKGALTHATRAKLVETVARAICRGAGVNPDNSGSGSGIVEGRQYLLWVDFIPQAEAVLDLIGFEGWTKTTG